MKISAKFGPFSLFILILFMILIRGGRRRLASQLNKLPMFNYQRLNPVPIIPSILSTIPYTFTATSIRQVGYTPENFRTRVGLKSGSVSFDDLLAELEEDYLKEQKEKESQTIDEKIEIIFSLLINNIPDNLHYSYRKFSEIYKKDILEPPHAYPKIIDTVIPKYRNEVDVETLDLSNDEWESLIEQLTSVRYINQSKKITKFLLCNVLKCEVEIPSIKAYSNLISFFSRKDEVGILKLIFQRMEQDGLKPTVQIYNIIGMNYMKRSRSLLEKLMIWLFLLQRMLSEDLKPDLCSWFITLSTFPNESLSRTKLKHLIIDKNLDHNLHFTEIDLMDKLTEGESLDSLIEYYNSLNKVSVNCMNTIIFKFLEQDDFKGAWNFMESQNTKFYKLPNSTATVFIKHLVKESNDLERAILVLNSLRIDYSLINFNPTRLILQYLLCYPDFNLPLYFPILVKYFVWYDLRYGIDRFRRTDVLFKRLRYKLKMNFSNSLDKYGIYFDKMDQFNSLELKIFENLEQLGITEDYMNRNDEILCGLDNGQWIIDVIYKGCHEWLEEVLVTTPVVPPSSPSSLPNPASTNVIEPNDSSDSSTI